ncbi:hypothetical protein [Paenibacillus qinlingensis]|uniref:hypothetical protein n=1 Tax=Paenibacillus qinlingensis TaxID=1837343 RepID=UPI001562FA74|nr:hypothetical protein [Paenibacillus qinlingensis]NQX60651.1 hypothetical protein [Paenibacillus qinlingensis]
MRILVPIILFLMVMAGCTSTSNALTLEQVVAAFQNEGMQLNQTEENQENIFQQGINGVTPGVYQLSDGVIHFYMFHSEKERIKGREDFYNRPVELVKHKAFVIHNVLIFYVYGKNQSDEVDERIKGAVAYLEKGREGK